MTRRRINLDKRFHPYQFQTEILTDKHQIKICRIGRRSGKSFLLIRWCIFYTMHTGHDSVIIAPSYKVIRRVQFKEALKLLLPLIKDKLVKINGTHYEIHFPAPLGKGGTVYFISGEEPESLRGMGDNLHRIVIDEAAYIPQFRYIFEDILSFMGLTHKIDYLICSTPRGKDYFYELAMRCRNPQYPEYREFHYSTREANPKITPEVIHKLIETHEWGPLQIRENIDAEFVSDDAGVFGDWFKCSSDYEYTYFPQEGHSYCIGADVALERDWTVLYVVDLTSRPARVVWKERFQKLDAKDKTRKPLTWLDVTEKIVALSTRFNRAKVYLDATGVGRPVLDHLKNRIPVMPVIFTADTKQNLVQGLAYIISKGELEFSRKDENLKTELGAYRSKSLPSGRLQYSAVEGYTDDAVTALMLSCYGVRKHLRPHGVKAIATIYEGETYDPYRRLSGVRDLRDFYKEDTDDGGYEIGKNY